MRTVLALLAALASTPLEAQTVQGEGAAPLVRKRRVPAEWEPQVGVWMQWPKPVEFSYRKDFSEIVDVAQDYEPVHLVVSSASALNGAKNYLTAQGVPPTNITWHTLSYDWAWMRDNGPVYVHEGPLEIVQDWGFNGWGGLVGYWGQDDTVPTQVASAIGATLEPYPMLNERGTLEFNGRDAVITSWPCLSDRNPTLTKEDVNARFRRAFGVTQVVFLESYPSADWTKGHVDGIARFVDERTAVVARHVSPTHPEAWIYDQAATIIAAAGFDVQRMDIPGTFTYKGVPMDADYMNWLVLNGAVISCGFNTPTWDAAAAAEIQTYYPGRAVHVVECRELWYWGGGIHCVTNDRPQPPR